MQRDEPTRHGRAADALIASYLRELLAEDEAVPAPAPTPAVPSDRPATVLAPPDAIRLEATL